MMAKCHQNDAGSVDLDAVGNYRLWTAFSGASFRKMIIDSVRCGVASLKRPECGSESKKKKKKGGSEKLLELMRRSEKVETLEELKMTVKRLQCDDVLWGAINVRRLTKENSEARIEACEVAQD